MRYRPSGAGKAVHEEDYSKEIIFSTDEFEEEGHLLQAVTVPPRTKQRLHLHREQTEVFYILEGEAVIQIRGQDYVGGPGDAFICDPGDAHSLWNQSDEDFRVVVFKINKPEEDDTDWLQGGEP